MNSPHPFPMQPLRDDAPESLRQAWQAARHAWRMEQVAVAEQSALLALRTSHSTSAYADYRVEHAEERTNLAFDKLWHEYRHAEHAMPQTAA